LLQLLLEDLLRKTNSGHPDYQNLVNAISKVKEVSQFVNKQKGLAGQSHRMFEIDSTITGFTGVRNPRHPFSSIAELLFDTPVRASSNTPHFDLSRKSSNPQDSSLRKRM
jgi:hypothetical protein